MRLDKSCRFDFSTTQSFEKLLRFELLLHNSNLKFFQKKVFNFNENLRVYLRFIQCIYINIHESDVSTCLCYLRFMSC